MRHRNLVARFVICAAVLSWSPATNAQAGAPIQTDAPVLFKADQLRNEQKIGLIVATGNVEFSQNGRTLLADSVSYNQRTDTVTANGNISLLEPSGEVLFADHLELTENMRNGIIENMRVQLTDDSRIAAVGGRRIGGTRTELRKAVYSPCELCEKDPTRAPIWQVKAFKVTHDRETRDITYRDAYLEFYGIPIMYTPFLSHPDPTVERRTGLLTPTYGSDTVLGTKVTLPYYIDIAPNMDATVTPLITELEGVVGLGEFRHRLHSTSYKLSGSLTEGTSPIDPSEDTLRGHIQGDLRHEFNPTWRGGADIYLSTDDTYLRRYKLGSDTELENRVFAEGFRGRNYLSADAYYFQGQRETDDQGDAPIVFPKLNINFVSEPAKYGGLWKFDADVLALSRTDGSDTRRMSAKTKWELPYISRLGEIYRVFASLQTDAYWVDELAEPDAPANTNSGLSGRVFPQAGMEWRLPFARKEEKFMQVVEPIFSIVLAPNGQNREQIPNEDSLSFEFDDTNLFSENRFGGVDRVEGGSRVTYGLNSGVFGSNNGFSSFFIGQSYRFFENDDFGRGTGLEDLFSDIVGRVEVSPSRYVTALYRFRLDKDSFSPRRNEVEGTLGVAAFKLHVNYLSLDRQSLSDIVNPQDEFPDREEISFGFSSQVTKRWGFGANTRRDLAPGGGTLSHTAYLNYDDDCFNLRVDYARNFTQDRDIRPTDTFLVRIVFKTLGEVAATSGSS